MRSISVSVLLFCAITFCAAQDPSKIATITIEQPMRPYHIHDTVRLKVTVTNLSKKEIRFEESGRGAWETETYDSLDSSGKDLALPLREKNAYQGQWETMVIPWSIAPGSKVTDWVLLVMSPDVMSHPGKYKVILRKRELVNNVIIRSSPVTIEITPK